MPRSGRFKSGKRKKVVETLNQFQAPLCRVLRDGRQVELSAEELVPGDIVALEAGDRVPADIRLIRSWNLRVNEAALTGESLPIDKNEPSLTEDCSLSERFNMLYMGTDVCGGKGTGVVVRTGMGTEIGHLMSLLKQQDKEATPLQEKVTSISKKVRQRRACCGGPCVCGGAAARHTDYADDFHFHYAGGFGHTGRAACNHNDRAKRGHIPHGEEKTR